MLFRYVGFFRPSFAQENNHALLFLQNYTCLLQTGYCYIFTYLGVVGEALINDSYSEQQLFKLVWAHCTTYP